MKTPGKVFILKNNEYIEITLQEHEVLKETMPGYLDKKFVFLHDCLMEVSEDFYVDFYRDKRRQKYLDECAVQCGTISYDMLSTDDFNGEDILIDHDVDVAEEVADSLMMEKLKQSVDLLLDEERKLVKALYFDNVSEHEYAKIIGISQAAVGSLLSVFRDNLVVVPCTLITVGTGVFFGLLRVDPA